MKKFAGLFVLLMMAVAPAMAQDASPQDNPPPQDTSSSQSTSSTSQTAPDQNEKPEKKKVSTLFRPKYEISAGFDHRSYGPAGSSRIGMHGWDGSFDYDWKSWLGFEGEIQGVYATISAPGAATATPSIYTILGGPQIFPFRHHKISPFGHFLYGEGYLRQAFGPYNSFGSSVNDFYSHAWEGGGGIDVKFKENWAVRGMFDYGSTRFGGGSGTSSDSSYRISIGLVYYLGRK
jgi:opacity protein-like surface antigen